MAFDFPTSPTVGQQSNGYTWNGTAWIVTTTSTAPASIGTAAPVSATNGDMWWNSNDGTQYMYYNDGNTSQWVESRSAIISDGYYSPNYVINGGFDINQRGTTSAPGGGAAWCSDRWQSSGMSTSNIYDLAPSDLVGTGLTKFLRMSRTSNVGNYPAIETHIEDVRTVPSGVPVTLSFYAKQNTAWNNGTWYVGWYQSFGTGGSTGNGNLTVQALSLTSSWARYSFTFTIDSVAGKTIGPNSYLNLLIRNNGNAQTAGEIDITGIQLENGSVATPFRRNQNTIQAELAACQRYYWRYTQDQSFQLMGVGSNWSGGEIVFTLKLPVTMRATPSASISDIGGVYWLGNNTNYSGASSFSQRTTKETWGFAATLSSPINVPLIFRPPLNSYMEANAEI